MSTGKRPSRDMSYHLATAERALLRKGFDAEALEEFLQLHEPDQRPFLLKSFQAPSVMKANARGELPDMNVLTGVSDPQLQEVLERVWAPTWAHLSLEQLERADPKTPGIMAARQLKRAAQERPE